MSTHNIFLSGEKRKKICHLGLAKAGLNSGVVLFFSGHYSEILCTQNVCFHGGKRKISILFGCNYGTMSI